MPEVNFAEIIIITDDTPNNTMSKPDKIDKDFGDYLGTFLLLYQWKFIRIKFKFCSIFQPYTVLHGFGASLIITATVNLEKNIKNYSETILFQLIVNKLEL